MLSETVTDANGAHRLDREYVWDANRHDQLVCRIRHLPSGPERLFPLYDPHGQVRALVDEGCDVLERYALDPQGHIRYLNADFSKKTAQASGYDWQHFCAGLRLDSSGLFFGRSTYYHVDLGRALPRGPIDVLPESRLNSYVQDFPTGDWQPPHASAEALYKWYNERSPWIKAGWWTQRPRRFWFQPSDVVTWQINHDRRMLVSVAASRYNLNSAFLAILCD